MLTNMTSDLDSVSNYEVGKTQHAGARYNRHEWQVGMLLAIPFFWIGNIEVKVSTTDRTMTERHLTVSAAERQR